MGLEGREGVLMTSCKRGVVQTVKLKNIKEGSSDIHLKAMRIQGEMAQGDQKWTSPYKSLKKEMSE